MKTKNSKFTETDIRLSSPIKEADEHPEMVDFYIDSAYTLQVSKDLADKAHPSQAHRNAIATASLVYQAMTGAEMDAAVQNVITLIPKKKTAKGVPHGW
ncbi:MAG: hypothetical protein NXI16_04155 [Alphaproteobacteria bacterium]|nr:hypothetical protein [Alphaproteobacteria bacterium]